MREIVIVIGDGGSGKTTYSKELERQGYKYISWDKDFGFTINLHNKLLLYNVLKQLNDLIGESQKVVLDGYSCQTDIDLKYFREVIHGNIIIKMPIAPEYIIAHRRAAVGEHFKVSQQYIKSNYFNLFRNNPSTIFVCTKDCNYTEYKFNGEKELGEFWKEYNRVPTQEDKREFFKNLRGCNPDWEYQDIEMFPYFHIGYIKAYYSWIRLKGIVDFTLKRVVDIGCSHGYYSFKVHEHNAKSVLGIEKNPKVFDTVRVIRDLKQYPVSFMLGDIDNKLSLPKRDITLVLNMLHYVKDMRQALHNIFYNTEQVLFELNPEQEAEVTKYAKDMSFARQFTMSSHRIDQTTKNNRIITHYKRIENV